MAEPTDKAAQRKKLIKQMMIPVLLLVLGVVFAWPKGKSDDDALNQQSDQVEAAVSPSTLQEQPAGRSEAELLAERRRKQVPKIELSQILQHDPFALPATLTEALAVGTPEASDKARKNEDRKRRVEEIVKSLQQKRVSLIFRGKGGVTAVLGSRTIHEGDLIEGEVRVIEIKPEGLTLEVINN
jgi:hypothetical protein